MAEHDDATTDFNTVTDSTTAKAPPVVSLPDPSSPAVAELAEKWKFGYSAVEAFGSDDLSPKGMQKAYVDMLQHPEEPIFKAYFKHSTMFHGPEVC